MMVTGPGAEDFANAETAGLLRKYLGTRAGVDGEARTRAMNMVSDLTTGDFGGHHAVLAIHAEGSLEAEKLMIFRACDRRRTVTCAKSIAGLWTRSRDGDHSNGGSFAWCSERRAMGAGPA